MSDTQFDLEMEKGHKDKFVKTIREIYEKAEYNETQLQSIRQTLLNQEKSLVHKTAELYNMVGLLIADAYICKNWNKELRKMWHVVPIS